VPTGTILAFHSCSSRRAFAKVALTFHAKIQGLGLQLVVHTDPPDRKVAGDRELLENDVDGSPQGGAEARFRRGRARESSDKAEIAVEDGGPGIQAHGLARRFDSTRAEGSRLGLAYARKIAHPHGGEVIAANRPGTGATFCITFPAAGKVA
jgi:signal transduction histidine kinase